MKKFYESIREDSYIYVNRECASHLYPAHFHINPEILVVNKGGYELTVSGRRLTVGEGDIAVIDSYEAHSYDRRLNIKDVDDIVLILPYSLVDKIMQDRQGRRIADPIIHDPTLCEEICDLAEKYLIPEISDTSRQIAATLIVSRIFERANLADKERGGEAALLRSILSYVQENFRSDISRSSIAKELGYTEAHISRVFHSYIGKGISEYVNGLRLAYIDGLIREGDKRSQTELIFEAGFGSQQTYYRARKREYLDPCEEKTK